MRRVLVLLVITTLVATGLSLWLNSTGFFHTLWFPGIPLFAAAALFVALLYQKRASPADRVSLLIGATVVRFLIALVVLLAVFLLHKGGFLYFFLHFVIQWFLFTVAEIAYLPFPQKKQTK